MALSEAQKKRLRGRGHQLKPVVMVGDAGLTKPLLAEFEVSLEHHELIKISIRVEDRDTRSAIIDELCSLSSAELVQRVGNMALLYRQKSKKS